jgi:hypothetical protein
VHIGTHKTGTTSIQTFLLENMSILKKKGFLIPDPSLLNDIRGFDEQLVVKYHTPEEEQIYDYIIDRKAGYFVKDIEHYEKKLVSKIQNKLLSKNKNIIISEEAFFDYHIVRFSRRMELLKKIIGFYKEKYDVKIIIYFRSQDSFIESMYSTYSILCFYSLSFESFLNQFQVESESDNNQLVSINWKDKVHIIKKYFPDEEIITRSFELASKKGLINDFMSITNLSGLELKPLIELKNVGLNKYGMNIMTNAGFLEKDDRELLFRAIWTDELFKKSKVGEKYHLLTNRQRILIYNKFFNSNKDLFGFSDEQMKELFYPKDQYGQSSSDMFIDKELLKCFILKIVSLQKKTLLFKFIFIRRKTIDRLPPSIRITLDRYFYWMWVWLCNIYWFFSSKR